LTYYGHGKLLLTGEYAVLDGADALAIPTRLGQSMTIKKTRGSDLIWESLEPSGEPWFSAQISLYDFSALQTNDEAVASTLQKILKNAVRLNPEFLDKWNGFKVETQLEFDRLWGLGSSSTLIHLVAQWADVHPLELYFKTFDGSGYDVACAGSDTPIVYYNDEDEIGYTPVTFDPSFKDQLYFVYLGNKQDSALGIKEYLKEAKGRKKLAKEITRITDAAVEAQSLADFRSLMDDHEQLIAKALNKTPVKEDRFSNFNGSIKSLGAWGGDFVMVMSEMDQDAITEYFQDKGCDVIVAFDDMIFKKK
jgi:mevalonate kinase